MCSLSCTFLLILDKTKSEWMQVVCCVNKIVVVIKSDLFAISMLGFCVGRLLRSWCYLVMSLLPPLTSVWGSLKNQGADRALQLSLCLHAIASIKWGSWQNWQLCLPKTPAETSENPLNPSASKGGLEHSKQTEIIYFQATSRNSFYVSVCQYWIH